MGFVVQQLALLAHSKTVLGLNPPANCSLSMWGLHVLFMPVLISSGCPGILPLSKDLLIRLTGYTKLTIVEWLFQIGDLHRVYPEVSSDWL